MKSILDLNIDLENPSDALHSKPVFQEREHELLQNYM
jgi:hypothetical protein